MMIFKTHSLRSALILWKYFCGYFRVSSNCVLPFSRRITDRLMKYNILIKHLIVNKALNFNKMLNFFQGCGHLVCDIPGEIDKGQLRDGLKKIARVPTKESWGCLREHVRRRIHRGSSNIRGAAVFHFIEFLMLNSIYRSVDRASRLALQFCPLSRRAVFPMLNRHVNFDLIIATKRILQ